jgi:hypothetical protein
MELVDAYLGANSLPALYDSVLIPVLIAVETDYRLERLDDDQRALAEQGLRDIIEDLGARPTCLSVRNAEKGDTLRVPVSTGRFCCLPARADRDELAAAMLVQLLRQQGFQAQSAPVKLGVDDLVRLVETSRPDGVCISVVTPSTVLHARHLCLKLRALLPQQRIVVGLWGATENVSDAARRVRESGADEVVTTLAEAVLQLSKLAPPPSEATAHTSTAATELGTLLVPG